MDCYPQGEEAIMRWKRTSLICSRCLELGDVTHKGMFKPFWHEKELTCNLCPVIAGYTCCLRSKEFQIIKFLGNRMAKRNRCIRQQRKGRWRHSCRQQEELHALAAIEKEEASCSTSSVSQWTEVAQLKVVDRWNSWFSDEKSEINSD